MSLTLHSTKAVYFVYETVLKWGGGVVKYTPNLHLIEMKPCGLGERVAICSLTSLLSMGDTPLTIFVLSECICDLNPRSFTLLRIQNSGPLTHCVHVWSTRLHLHTQPRSQRPQNILGSRTVIYAC
jgi:hypothetical protein